VSRDREEGVILINVLVILSLAATVVYVMLTLADVAIARSQGFRDAGEGLALVQGAEQFAIAALRRDMIEAPDTDNAAEPWNRLAQDAIDIPGGTLELRIEDAQGLFNVNVIAAERAQGEETLRLIGEAAGLPPEVISRIATSLDLDGPVRRIADLGVRVGLSPAEAAALGRFATALPGKSEVNLNAVPVDLLSLLIGSGAKARLLVNRRDGDGLLTAQDLESAQVVPPPGIGYRSDFFRLRTTARMGATVQSVESLLMRREGPAGPEVTVVERRNAIPAAFPPPPES
jgi:general secretion pathway protein K